MISFFWINEYWVLILWSLRNMEYQSMSWGYHGITFYMRILKDASIKQASLLIILLLIILEGQLI